MAAQAGVAELNKDSPTPGSGKRGSGGAGRPPKKTVGRKPGPKTAAQPAASMAASLRGELGSELAAGDVGCKAKRSKATPVATREPSTRAKAKLGDLSSLESAKLRVADKNLDVSGNPLPSFTILSAFSDDHLVSILLDSGVELGSSSADIIPLVRAREEAQAALAEAAARCQALDAQENCPGGQLVVVVPEGEAEPREGSDLPSSSRVPARKRVQKAVSSRGVRLRNRVL